MNISNIEVQARIAVGGKVVGATVNFDWVGKEVFINNVSQYGDNITSLLSIEEDDNLVNMLKKHCERVYET